ncbi:MAG: glycosyltransferase family 4 protein [Bacteroidia bacterium]
MKILYLHQYFQTPGESGGIRSYHLAKAMLSAGHEVVMITSHNSDSLVKKNVEGIEVWYLPVRYANEMGTFQRMVAFSAFVIRAFLTSRKIKNVALCFATSTPLTIGIIALLLKKINKTPYIFEVRDLWPEAPVQMGVIKHRLLKKALYRLERMIYLNASKIIALSPGIAEGIRANGGKVPIPMIPNMSDCQFFYPGYSTQSADIQSFQNAGFRVIYFGAMGKANHLDYLIRLAEACQQQSLDIHFLIAGSGSEKRRLEKLAGELRNTTFLPAVNKHHIREYLSIAHAAYISFAQIPVLETTSPNKFFDSLAAGKMILVNFNGWIRDLTEENECGIYTDPGDPEGSAQKLGALVRLPGQIINYQKNARRLAESQFDKEKLCRQVVQVMESVISPA